jgi:RimJ/RimL family protein N-acetyltransferase
MVDRPNRDAIVLLHTPRMTLREITHDDVDALTELDSDPLVRRYVHLPEAPTREQVASDFLPRIRALYANGEGLGYWIAEDRETGEFLGWFHLKREPDRGNHIAVGYRLRRAVWGCGLATEGTIALNRHALQVLNAPCVIALTLAENTASIRVMQKAGMKEHARFQVEAGVNVVEYMSTRE